MSLLHFKDLLNQLTHLDVDSPVKQKRPSTKKRIVDSDSDEADEPAKVKVEERSKSTSQGSANGKDSEQNRF